MSDAIPEPASESDALAALDPLDSPDAGGRAIRGVAIRTVLFGAGLLLNLLTVPFMIRHLGPVDYGYYITVASIVFVIGAVTEAGLNNLGVRHWATAEAGDRRELMRNLVGLRVTLTSAGLLAAVGLTALAGSPEVVVAGVLVYGLGLLVSMIAYTYGIPLAASLRLGTTAGLDFMRQALLAAGTIALVVAGAALLPFFALWVAVSAVAVVATALLVRGQMSVRPAFHPGTWWAFLRETVAYSLAAAVGLVYFRVAMVGMGYLSTDLQAGYYAAPFRIIETATNLPWMFVTSVFPILARAATRDPERLRYAVQRIVDVGLLAGIWMTLVLAVGAAWVMGIIADMPRFEPAIDVLRLQALTLVSTFLVATWSLVLLSLGRMRALLVTNLAAVVVAVVAAVVLIPPLGAEGGALATILAESFLALAYYVALRRADPALATRFGILLKLFVATLAALAVVLLGLPAVPELVLLTAVYFAVALALRAVPLELFRALLRRA